MKKFAADTSVPAERSKAEVEKLLTRFGADQFASGWMASRAVVSFRMNDRQIRIEIPMPTLSDPKTPSWNRVKGQFYHQDKVDQEVRRRWRALLLYVKAKLESVHSDIVSFEEAFMSHVVLPNRQTVGQFMSPQIESAYKGGKMPLALGFDG